tara:strand:- start:271 stop:642 length:372 start_codon:yes stop_codon:yes gene_type:complete
MSGNRDFVVYSGESGAYAFNQAMRDSFTDMLMHGESAYSASRRNGEPTVERVDPRNVVYGDGIMSQIENANIQHYTPFTEDNLISFLKGMDGDDREVKKTRRRSARVTNKPARTNLLRARDDR